MYFLTTYYLSYKNDEVGGVCGTCVWRTEMHAGF